MVIKCSICLELADRGYPWGKLEIEATTILNGYAVCEKHRKLIGSGEAGARAEVIASTSPGEFST